MKKIVFIGGLMLPISALLAGPQLDRNIDEIVKRTIALRQLQPQSEYEIHALPPQSTDQKESASGLKQRRLLEVLGIPQLPPSGPLFHRLKGTDQAATNGKEIGISISLIKKKHQTLAHEITHVLDIQNFQNTYLKQPLSTDEALAKRALFEGDATFIERHFFDDGDLDQRTAKNSRPIERKGEIAEFLYDRGCYFIDFLYRKGGWDLVNEAFKNPPRSTSEILHPDRYPMLTTSPSFPYLDPRLRTLFPNVIEEGILGEWLIRKMLSMEMSFTDARRAADGWVTDQAYIAGSNDGETIFSLSTEWATETEAKEFFEAASHWAMKRSDQRNMKPLRSENQFFISDRSKRVRIHMNGSRVYVQEFPPSAWISFPG